MSAGNPNWKKGQSGNPGGRPKKWNIQDYIDDKDVEGLVKLAKKEANAGKIDMVKFLLEQIFGKARQNLGLDGGDTGKPLNILFDKVFEDYGKYKEAKEKQAKNEEV